MEIALPAAWGGQVVLSPLASLRQVLGEHEFPTWADFKSLQCRWDEYVFKVPLEASPLARGRGLQMISIWHLRQTVDGTNF